MVLLMYMRVCVRVCYGGLEKKKMTSNKLAMLYKLGWGLRVRSKQVCRQESLDHSKMMVHRLHPMMPRFTDTHTAIEPASDRSVHGGMNLKYRGCSQPRRARGHGKKRKIGKGRYQQATGLVNSSCSTQTLKTWRGGGSHAINVLST